MRKFFKILFGRMTLVTVAIIGQLLISVALPYLLNYFHPEIFGQLFLTIQMAATLIAVIMIVAIINSDMIAEGKIIWIILFFVFPLFAIVIYRLFVWHKAPRKHRRYSQKVKDAVKEINIQTKQEELDLKSKIGEDFGQFQYIYNSLNLKTYTNTQVQYLKNGEEFHKELLEDLKKAKKYIFMEYFIIERGQMWDSILKILEEKASQGLDIRIMYDDIGAMYKLPYNYPNKLKKIGIKCVKFNSFIPIASALHNNRDHRKMTIIDGKVGYVSGLNIADEYINVVQRFGYWKDTGVKIRGKAIESLLLMFLQLYNVQTQNMDSYKDYLKDVKPINSNGFVCPFGDGPKYFYSEYVAENVYLNIINNAHDYLWITTPYLIIDSKLTNALCLAAKRGVDVRIITPHIPDKKTIFMLTRSSYRLLKAAGVKIYEYEKGFVHAKQFLVDDDLAIVGTINLDYRSLLHHYECGVLMKGVSCIKDIKADFEDMFKSSIDMKDYKQSKFIRLYCAIIKAFTPML